MMTREKNIRKLLFSLLFPLFLAALNFYLYSLQFHQITVLLIVIPSLLLFMVLFSSHFQIKLNQSSVYRQLKSGLIISMLGLLSLLFANFILNLFCDISILELFRGSKKINFNLSSGYTYLLWVGVYGPLFEEVYFRAFTLSVLNKWGGLKPLNYYVGRFSAVVSFVLVHVLTIGFSVWSVAIWGVCAVITTILYDYYKGYWAGFVVHGLANTVLVLLSWRLI